jgi:glutaredoxin
MEIIPPRTNGYFIYTKKDCPFCDKVKKLLENESVCFVPCDDYIKEKKDKETFLDFIESITQIKHKTFPMVFLDGDFLGGFTETKKYYDKVNAFSLDSSF